MNREKVVFGYEDLERDIEVEILGLKFYIGITEEKARNIKNAIRNLNEKSEEEQFKELINTMLGEKAFDEIKEKYKRDRNKDIEIIMWVKILDFIYRGIFTYQEKIKEQYRPQYRANRRENRHRRSRTNYGRY